MTRWYYELTSFYPYSSTHSRFYNRRLWFRCVSFLVVVVSFLKDFNNIFIHILQKCFSCTGASIAIASVQAKQPWRICIKSNTTSHTKHNNMRTVCLNVAMCHSYCRERANVNWIDAADPTKHIIVIDQKKLHLCTWFIFEGVNSNGS